MKKVICLGDLKLTFVADEDNSGWFDVTIEQIHNAVKPIKTSCQSVDIAELALALEELSR